jgi:thioredoxin 2
VLALERLAHEWVRKLNVMKVNVDTSPSLSRRFEVLDVPTLVVLPSGGVVSRPTGAVARRALAA